MAGLFPFQTLPKFSCSGFDDLKGVFEFFAAKVSIDFFGFLCFAFFRQLSARKLNDHFAYDGSDVMHNVGGRYHHALADA